MNLNLNMNLKLTLIPSQGRYRGSLTIRTGYEFTEERLLTLRKHSAADCKVRIKPSPQES